ncbi:hypothetical protein JRO89_XS15G0150700 [Xanthoceras sorbifolium]|uniref:Peptidase A1 domain-containing protein n=1 Tax=Xanthoceras sorbifolium TaxID=99658 RepID=A0ABQ8H298_9ROSI|nr:hypothetical protein JRO89_XS15G0150700 [Xanthoceras sorbifolium]
MSKLHLSDSKLSGFSLKLIPRDSPESPIYPSNLSQIERIARLIGFTQAKSNYAQFLLSTTQNAILDRDRFFCSSTSRFESRVLFYIAEVGTGTPLLKVLLSFTLVLTGNASVESPMAVEVQAIQRVLRPLNHSSFQQMVKVRKTINNIIFGCSNDNQNFATFQRNGQIFRIMGMDLSPDSLFRQLLAKIGNRFSYCVTPFEDILLAPSLIRFGDDIPPPRPNIQQTPFYTIPYAFSFYLNLADISVGLHRLHFPPDIFRAIQGGTTSGLIIDSGAAYTVIDQRNNGWSQCL